MVLCREAGQGFRSCYLSTSRGDLYFKEVIVAKTETKEVPRAYVKTFKGKGWKVKEDNPKSEFVKMIKESK